MLRASASFSGRSRIAGVCVEGPSSMRRRDTTVKPSTPGRFAAIRTRAGRSDRASRSASGPSPDAVTSNPACDKALPRARCTVGSASTTRILTAMTYLFGGFDSSSGPDGKQPPYILTYRWDARIDYMQPDAPEASAAAPFTPSTPRAAGSELVLLSSARTATRNSRPSGLGTRGLVHRAVDH